MDLNTITVQDFKDLFVRDFDYGVNKSNVMDSDITRAFGEAQMVFNQGLGFANGDQGIKLAYLYLTAHYVVNDAKAASTGIGGGASFPVTSRTVGSVSESYSIPAPYADNAILLGYTTSPYGQKYLSFVLPLLVGNVVGIYGGTQP